MALLLSGVPVERQVHFSRLSAAPSSGDREPKQHVTEASCVIANQVWDTALRAVGQAWGVRNCPPFVQLMQIAVAGLARKPVRARCRTLISNGMSVHLGLNQGLLYCSCKSKPDCMRLHTMAAVLQPQHFMWAPYLLSAESHAISCTDCATLASALMWCAAIHTNRFQVHRVEAALNMDALLGAARDYFERVTREFHAKGPGGAPRQPADVEARDYSASLLWFESAANLPHVSLLAADALSNTACQ